MSNELATTNNEMIMALDKATESGLIAQSQASAFQRTFAVAESVSHLQQILTDQNMQPIMNLQGLKIGFKTDKVYPVNIVRNCLIEAVMTGVYPTGNQFNIIANNCYITKEGMGYLLSQIDGLGYSITPMIPKTNGKEAIIKMCIEWNFNGKKDSRDIDFCIKVNSYMGSDAIIGKATRKARAWLLMHITGQDIGEGDSDDIALEKRVENPSAKDILSDLKNDSSVIDIATDEQLIDAIDCAYIDVIMYFKNLSGKWGIKENLSELGENERSIIMNDPLKVKAAIDKMKNDLV